MNIKANLDGTTFSYNSCDHWSCRLIYTKQFVLYVWIEHVQASCRLIYTKQFVLYVWIEHVQASCRRQL